MRGVRQRTGKRIVEVIHRRRNLIQGTVIVVWLKLEVMIRHSMVTDILGFEREILRRCKATIPPKYSWLQFLEKRKGNNVIKMFTVRFVSSVTYKVQKQRRKFAKLFLV